MSGHLEVVEESIEAGLDWSVSGISAASGFDPERYHTESSAWPTPEKFRPIGSQEIAQLAGNVRDLRQSLVSISEKSLTPLNSPRQQSSQEVTQRMANQEWQKVFYTSRIG
jgi:hypothetical protein